jgi:hydroxysqualene synthase
MEESFSLKDAYAHCRRIVRGHYENFPVASLAVPARLRPHVAAVYAFARHADDIADEGVMDVARRLEGLAAWREKLHACVQGDATDPIFIALGDTIRRFSLPVELLNDLIDAFVQDSTQQDYERFDEIIDYCTRSANPVGRIVLSLYGLLDEERGRYSDALCTGLQLANFWQDVSVDRLKPRVYIPKEDLSSFDVGIDEILQGNDSERVRSCIAFQVERTRAFFRDATPLFALTPLRLRIELRAIWMGGYRILEKIEKQQYTTVRYRPVLTTFDYILMASHALLKGPVHV